MTDLMKMVLTVTAAGFVGLYAGLSMQAQRPADVAIYDPVPENLASLEGQADIAMAVDFGRRQD